MRHGHHDRVKTTGLFYKFGSIVQALSNTERVLHDRWADVAVMPSAPFSIAERLSPELWQAISVIIKEAK